MVPGVLLLQRLSGGEQLDALLQLDAGLLLRDLHAAVLHVALQRHTRRSADVSRSVQQNRRRGVTDLCLVLVVEALLQVGVPVDGHVGLSCGAEAGV